MNTDAEAETFALMWLPIRGAKAYDRRVALADLLKRIYAAGRDAGLEEAAGECERRAANLESRPAPPANLFSPGMEAQSQSVRDGGVMVLEALVPAIRALKDRK